MTKNIYAEKVTVLAILMLLLVSSFYCYNFFIQVAPSVMTEELMRNFSVDATAIGAMSGAFYYSYTFFQIPAGLLFDRYGVHIILTIAILVCSLGTLLFGFAHNLATAEIARILMGAGGAFSFIGSLYIILRWFPPWTFALFAGITQLMSSVGSIGGEAPLVAMVQHMGWRHSMFVLAIVGFILTALILFFVRNQPKNYVAHDLKKLSVFKSLKTVLHNPQAWYIAIYSFAIWAPIVAFSALWGVPFIKTSYHISNFAAAQVVSFSWLGIALGSPILGWISDKIHRRSLILALSALLGFISILCIIFIPHMPIYVLYLLLFFTGWAAGGQSLSFAVIKEINYTNVTSTANGINNMAIVSGGIIFQPLIGKLLDAHWSGTLVNGVRTYGLHSYHVAFSVLPACFLLAFIMSAFFIKETHCKTVI